MQVTGYFDQAGDPRARCIPAYDLLEGFLESDLQGSVNLSRETLREIDRVANGDRESWQDTGNAYTLIVSAQEARIEAELDDQAKPCRLPLADLREAVAQWIAFLEQENRT